jgi:FkbM family methyltransferase
VELARRSRRFCDVGANTGTYSLIAAAVNPTIDVVAFEPLPAAAAALRANIEANQWAERITVVQKAACEKTGLASLHSPSRALPTSASLAPGGFRGIEGTLIPVECVRLDDQLEGQAVDLVKIDVEHFEHEVLRGMPQILERDNPTIVVECHPEGPFREIEALLVPLGYRFLHLESEASTLRDRIQPSSSPHGRNIVCLPHGQILEPRSKRGRSV